jgi:hypothetical protein
VTVKQVGGHSEMTSFRELRLGLHDLSFIALADQRNSTTQGVLDICQRQSVDFSKPRVSKQHLHGRPNFATKTVQKMQVDTSFLKVVAPV